jgi:hypothetical protein
MLNPKSLEHVKKKVMDIVTLADGRTLAECVAMGGELSCTAIADIQSYRIQIQERLAEIKLAVEYAHSSETNVDFVQRHLNFVDNSAGHQIYMCFLRGPNSLVYILFDDEDNSYYIDDRPPYAGRK